MRRPEDRRCIAWATASLEASRLRWVSIAEMLVRMERDISWHLRGGRFSCPGRLRVGLLDEVIAAPGRDFRHVHGTWTATRRARSIASAGDDLLRAPRARSRAHRARSLQG